MVRTGMKICVQSACLLPVCLFKWWGALIGRPIKGRWYLQPVRVPTLIQPTAREDGRHGDLLRRQQ
jgi:hypothetical protein